MRFKQRHTKQMSMKARKVLVCALALSLAASCVPADDADEEEPGEVIEYGENTTMGIIQAEGTLPVGISGESPFVRQEDGISGPTGLSVGIASLVANELGVELEIETGEPRDLFKKLDRPRVAEGEDPIEPELYLVFPPVPLTEELGRANAFTHPYVVSHQRLLVLEDSTIEEAKDLAGHKVCQLDEPGTAVDIEEIVPDVEVVPGDVDDCLLMVQREEIAAVTGPDIVLSDMVRTSGGDPEVVVRGPQLNTVGYSAAVPPGMRAWTDFVNRTLAEAESEGLWASVLTDALGSEYPTEEPPTLTWEQAASLYPDD